jgi:queuine/archaeosine tRNA-ribosyltransferase
MRASIEADEFAEFVERFHQQRATLAAKT